MDNRPEVGGDVVAAAAALAGFILVYLGAVATSFATFDAVQQSSVRAAFRRRAWFSFAGISLALATVFFAILGKLSESKWESNLAICFLALTLLASLVIALLATMDVK